MASSNRFFSIKSLFIWVVMAISAFTLLLASSLSLYNQIHSHKQELIQKVSIFADLISRNAASSIVFDDSITEEQNLQALVVADFIDNVHIYNINLNGQLEFFASYNKPGQAPVRVMINRVDELSTPLYSDEALEIIRPVTIKNENNQVNLVGYIYLKASLQSLNSLITNTFVITISVLFVALILGLLLTLKLHKTVTSPIENLVALVQRVSQQKDYSARAEKSKLEELDILSIAFNDMLGRIQQHIQRQEEAEIEFRQLNTNLEEKVNQRTVALKEANQELIQTLEKLHQFQRQMVQNEKMASLGDMVAGVAHEVNTPIGLGVTASTMMLDRLAQLKTDFDNKALKASTLSKFIDEGQENLNIIYRNLNRSAELISSFKQVAVDQTSEGNRTFEFTQLMDEILLSLKPKLKKLPHQINLHCSNDLLVKTKAGPINQIMINLIMNSVIHGFEFIEQGQIDIYAELTDDSKMKILYKDNGKGLPEHLRKRIFDPFVTTKRGQGGSGLGMHLVYNLVTQALNGSISVTSEEQKGVEFEIQFPVKKIDAADMAQTS